MANNTPIKADYYIFNSRLNKGIEHTYQLNINNATNHYTKPLNPQINPIIVLGWTVWSHLTICLTLYRVSSDKKCQNMTKNTHVIQERLDNTEAPLIPSYY